MRQFTCVLIALAVVGVYGDEPEKIVNGQPTSIQQYPSAISMRNNGQHMCGGSLIHQQYVLTAAHCLQGLSARQLSSIRIYTGTTYLSQGGQAHAIERVWVHEQYNPNAYMHDIGLIKLTSPVQLNSQQQIVQLPSRSVTKDEAVTLVAWGSEGLGKRVHNDLRKMSSKVMLPETCRSYHQGVMGIGTNEFCTMQSYGTGACHGDSGSGVIRDSDRTIIGAVSRGRPCAVGYPDVFTNVYSYVSWIRQKMAQ